MFKSEEMGGEGRGEVQRLRPGVLPSPGTERIRNDVCKALEYRHRMLALSPLMDIVNFSVTKSSLSWFTVNNYIFKAYTIML